MAHESPGSLTDDLSASAADLADWGLPLRVVKCYRDAGISSLFPWQSACLRSSGALDGANLVYSAPTSAGKTLVAELLLLKRILETRRKGIVILPYISVAREKMLHLQRVFSGAGVRVGGFMGSLSNPRGFEGCDVAVCTIEKANGLLNRLLELRTPELIGTVIVDELHMVGDPNRGYLLELLLTKLVFLKQRRGIDIQIIGMSATLPNLPALATWLQASLYTTEFRPIPLLEHTCTARGIRQKGSSEPTQLPPMFRLAEDEDKVMGLCLEALASGFGTIVFCASKRQCETLAEAVARRVQPLLAAAAASPLAAAVAGVFNFGRQKALAEEFGRVGGDRPDQQRLAKMLLFGVAFHHAGLTMEEREVVERGFRRGLLKVVTATSTLSAGVNLPARRVLIRSLWGSQTGPSLTPTLYQQMIGRAGRKGLDDKGESFLCCKEAELPRALALVGGAVHPVSSALHAQDPALPNRPLRRALLEVIVGGLCGLRSELGAYLRLSLFGTGLGEAELAPFVSAALDFLKDNRFVDLTPTADGTDASVHVSQLGWGAFASSLSPDEALSVYEDLCSARESVVLTSDLHLLYLVTPLYLSAHWPSSCKWSDVYEISAASLPAELRVVAERVGVEEAFLLKMAFRNASKEAGARTGQVHMRFYTALALYELISEKPLAAVANRFGADRGFLQGLQQQAAVYAGMVTTLCARLGWDHLATLLAGFAERISFGVRRELTELVRIEGIDGSRARAFHSAGLNSIASLAAAPGEEVAAALRKAVAFDAANEGGVSGWLSAHPDLPEAEAVTLIKDRASALLADSLAALGLQGIPLGQPAPHHRRAAEERRRSSLGSSLSSTPVSLGHRRRSPLSQLNGAATSTPLTASRPAFSAGSQMASRARASEENEEGDSLGSLRLDESSPDSLAKKTISFDRDPRRSSSSFSEARVSKSGSQIDSVIPDHLVSAKTLLSRNLAKRSSLHSLKEDVSGDLLASISNVSLDDEDEDKIAKKPNRVSLSDSSLERIMATSFNSPKAEQAKAPTNASPKDCSMTPSEAFAIASMTIDWDAPSVGASETQALQASTSAHQESSEDLFADETDGSLAGSSGSGKRGRLDSPSSLMSPASRPLTLLRKKTRLEAGGTASSPEAGGEPVVEMVARSLSTFRAFSKFIADRKGQACALALHTQPLPGKAPAPRIGARYMEAAGPSESAASGVELPREKLRLLGVVFAFGGSTVHYLDLTMSGGASISFTPKAGSPSLGSRLGLVADAVQRLAIVSSSAQSAYRCVWSLGACQRHLETGKAAEGPAFCARTAAWLLRRSEEETCPTLASLVRQYLPGSPLTRALRGDGLEAAVAEARVLLLLRPAMEGAMDAPCLKAFHGLELKIIPHLARMEVVGMRLDLDEAKELEARIAKRMRRLEKDAERHLGHRINLGSAAEVARALFVELKLPHPGKTGQQPRRQLSTAKEVLEKISEAHPVVGTVLEWRQLTHSHGTGLLPLIRAARELPFLESHGVRVAGSFETATATGRIVMSGPNLQNLPKELTIAAQELSLRSLFVPRPGFALVSADFSQLELRVLAALSGDAALGGILRQREGDVFRLLAKEWRGTEAGDRERQQAKQLTYGLIYGMGAGTMGATLGVSEAEARGFMTDFRRKFPEVSAWCEGTIRGCARRGFVSTLGGRRRVLSSLGKEAQMERQAVNSAVQGSAADIFKAALLSASAVALAFGGEVVMQLHDELILELPSASMPASAARLKAAMEGAWALGAGIPLRAKLQQGDAWGELEPLEL